MNFVRNSVQTFGGFTPPYIENILGIRMKTERLHQTIDSLFRPFHSPPEAFSLTFPPVGRASADDPEFIDHLGCEQEFTS